MAKKQIADNGRQRNRILTLAVEKIKQRESEADQRTLLRALGYSLDGDGGMPPKILSPHHIEEMTGVSIKEQFDHQILLDRHRSIEFLQSLSYDLKRDAFRKKLAKKHWDTPKLFKGRQLALVGNSYVFTYLEILKIEQRIFTPDLDEYITSNSR